MDDGICAEVLLEVAGSAYFLSHSSLVPPLKNFKKWPILVFFAKLAIALNCRHFWSRGLRQNVVQ